MRVAIGCDEAGYDLKEKLKAQLAQLGASVSDYGVQENETALYPDIAFAVAEAVADGKHDRAVLICGTGIGMCISANKVKGIRAAQAHDTYSAERAQKSNDAQVLCIGARVVGPELAKSIVEAWYRSSFEQGRSTAKVERIASFESKGG
ncbi:ribose 5-phosphate isomerase B [Tabrizicola sp. M-4]|uniref:ribose 5-phosphate isomerase B n=1 Tax=Tabrizicola sp. M-4 TaxID=3055847 RepID=UPI003DA84DA7